MHAREFRWQREIAVMVHEDGSKRSGGLVWEPTAIVEPAGIRRDIVRVVTSVGFFGWP